MTNLNRNLVLMSAAREKSPISEWRLILSMQALYIVLQGVTLLRIYVQMRLDNLRPDFATLIEERIVALLVALLYIILIVKTTRRFLIARLSWPRIITIHLFFAVLITLLWYSTFIVLSFFLCPEGGDCIGMGTRQQLVYWYLINFDKIVLVYLFTVSMTYAYYYVTRDSMHQVQKAQIEQQLLRTRLQVLQSQLHPHFLFNTLNSIASLIDIDIRRAQKMIADLGDLLRQVLDSRDQPFVTIQEEIDLLSKYLDIERTRFSEDLEIELNVDPGLEQALVPFMLLQPIVENSIRHGYSRQTPILHVDIRIFRQENRLVLSVEDNGRGLPDSDHRHPDVFQRGTGLRNTSQRLQSLYGEQHRFVVENRGPGVRNYIELPLQFDKRPALANRLA